MTGWNMPPGCNVSDIPGNRPEDQKAEALSEAIWELLLKYQPNIKDTEDNMKLVDELAKLVGEECHKSYQDGMSDQALVQDVAESFSDLTGGEDKLHLKEYPSSVRGD